MGSDEVGPSGHAETLLKVQGLGKRYKLAGGRSFAAMDDVSFEVERGTCFGLVGESGSGKSTVAKSLLRLHSVDEGHVLFRGTDVFGLGKRPLREFRKSAQMVFQDPFASLNRRQRVGQLIEAPMVAHGVFQGERRRRSDELLDLVGLNSRYRTRYTHELSGGQCQRVAIARALALDPALVVLDEAVSALDVSVRAQILNLLKELQSRLALTYVFISHDLSVVRYMSDTIAVMYMGKIVESGPRELIFGRPQHPYTKGLLAAVPVANPAIERRRRHGAVPVELEVVEIPEEGCPFRPRCPVGSDREICAGHSPALTADETGAAVACHFPREEISDLLAAQ
jgi:oligopeptide/dipeptide ABC transporter ATP-binding protein